jgi:hypothetical protein
MDGGETGIVFDFGEPCQQDGLASKAPASSCPSAPLTTTPADATSASPLARPADQLEDQDVVEVYLSLKADKPLLYQCGYHLYCALCMHVSWLHGGPALIKPLGFGALIRLPRQDVARVMGLEGAELLVGWNRARVTALAVREIVASTELYSPLVCFDRTIRSEDAGKHGKKTCKQGADLILSVGASLERLGISGVGIELDEGVRRLDMGKKRGIAGQGLTLTRLLPEASIKLQKMGMGAKGRMGCGVFLPLTRGR